MTNTLLPIQAVARKLEIPEKYKKVVITSREPSLGPVFGRKGGAAGGGLSQIEPSSKINLHFNGDFYAISSAHNLRAALIDAHLPWQRAAPRSRPDYLAARHRHE